MNATNSAALRREMMECVRRDSVPIGRVVSTAGSQIVVLLDGDVSDPNVVQMEASLVSAVRTRMFTESSLASARRCLGQPARVQS